MHCILKIHMMLKRAIHKWRYSKKGGKWLHKWGFGVILRHICGIKMREMVKILGKWGEVIYGCRQKHSLHHLLWHSYGEMTYHFRMSVRNWQKLYCQKSTSEFRQFFWLNSISKLPHKPHYFDNQSQSIIRFQAFSESLDFNDCTKDLNLLLFHARFLLNC